MLKSIWIPATIIAAYGLGFLHAGSSGSQIVRIKEPKTKAELVRLIETMNKDLDKMDGIVEDELDAHADLLKAIKKVEKEQHMSFNLQYLSLQQQMQNENRQYSAVSNILKTKHDTVKNSIGNIR